MYDLDSMDKRLVIFGYLFRVANRLQSKMDAQMTGLTSKQWFVILALGFFDEPPTLKQLASICDSSHQNTKQLVMKLKDKGFVTIDNDAADGRAMRIIMTEKCAQWDADNEDIAIHFVDEMFAGLSPDEIVALCGSLMKVFDNLGNIYGGKSHA